VSPIHALRRRALQIAGTILLAIFVTAGGAEFASAATVTSKTPDSSTTLTSHLNTATGTRVAAPDARFGPKAFTFGPKVFTPQNSTFRGADADGTLEASYNYHTSPGTFGWRYEVNPALCAGGEGATVTSNIYNNGGLVPNTHYSKIGVTPCYGFHASFATNKINTKGNYQLRGTIRWRDGDATLTLSFTFNFIITDV
jgi:hypothetical protein